MSHVHNREPFQFSKTVLNKASFAAKAAMLILQDIFG